MALCSSPGHLQGSIVFLTTKRFTSETTRFSSVSLFSLERFDSTGSFSDLSISICSSLTIKTSRKCLRDRPFSKNLVLLAADFLQLLNKDSCFIETVPSPQLPLPPEWVSVQMPWQWGGNKTSIFEDIWQHLLSGQQTTNWQPPSVLTNPPTRSFNNSWEWKKKQHNGYFVSRNVNIKYVIEALFLTTFVSVSTESPNKSSSSVNKLPSVLQSSWMNGWQR